MAEKKAAPNKQEQFENAVYDLGLTLIDRYVSGKYASGERNEILETIVEIFKSAREESKRG